MATIRADHHAVITGLADKNRTSNEAEIDKLLTTAFLVRRIPMIGEAGK
jgi:hypothetical protein